LETDTRVKGRSFSIHYSYLAFGSLNRFPLSGIFIVINNLSVILDLGSLFCKRHNLDLMIEKSSIS